MWDKKENKQKEAGFNPFLKKLWGIRTNDLLNVIRIPNR